MITSAHYLSTTEKDDSIVFLAIDADVFVVKSEDNNLDKRHHSLKKKTMHVMDITTTKKNIVVDCNSNMGQGLTLALNTYGGIIHIARINPICTCQSHMETIVQISLRTIAYHST